MKDQLLQHKEKVLSVADVYSEGALVWAVLGEGGRGVLAKNLPDSWNRAVALVDAGSFVA